MDSDKEQQCFLVGDTFGLAVVDTGCPQTVAGRNWFQNYICTLSRKDKLFIKTKQSTNSFRFGDGTTYPSKFHCVVPIYINDCRHNIGVDIVDCNVPLLLSRETLRRAKAKIDISAATILFLGKTLPLTISPSGHMCLQVGRSLDIDNVETKKLLSRVLFTCPLDGNSISVKNKASKLHVQFCHPTAKRLIDLVKRAGCTDARIFEAIKEVSFNCEVCLKTKRAPLRPTVGFPLATHFNEVVALDLKFRGSDGYILHMIDHLTRYSSACIIRDKTKETIVEKILEYWIRIFGSPKYFLTDNGGEFVNRDMIDLAEKFNISLRTTAAESAW